LIGIKRCALFIWIRTAKGRPIEAAFCFGMMFFAVTTPFDKILQAHYRHGVATYCCNPTPDFQ